MNDTLLVQVHEAVQDLADVDARERFRELAKLFADRLQRSVLAVPR